MRKGMQTSLIMHIVIFLLLFFGLPTFTPKRSYEAQIVTVEVLNVTDFTNIKPANKKIPTPKKRSEVITENAPKISKLRPKKKDSIKIEPLPQPIIKKKTPPKQEIVKLKPLQKPKKIKKKETPPKPQKKYKSEYDFASVIKSVEEGRQKPEEQVKEETLDFDQAVDFLSKQEMKYRDGEPLSISERGAIRQQIMRNWTVPSGAKNIEKTVVTVYIQLSSAAHVTKVEVRDKSSYNSNSFFRAIADSAVRAIYKSSPLRNLPLEKYDTKDGWRELEINFDPREMVY